MSFTKGSYNALEAAIKLARYLSGATDGHYGTKTFPRSLNKSVTATELNPRHFCLPTAATCRVSLYLCSVVSLSPTDWFFLIPWRFFWVLDVWLYELSKLIRWCKLAGSDWLLSSASCAMQYLHLALIQNDVKYDSLMQLATVMLGSCRSDLKHSVTDFSEAMAVETSWGSDSVIS